MLVQLSSSSSTYFWLLRASLSVHFENFFHFGRARITRKLKSLKVSLGCATTRLYCSLSFSVLFFSQLLHATDNIKLKLLSAGITLKYCAHFYFSYVYKSWMESMRCCFQLFFIFVLRRSLIFSFFSLLLVETKSTQAKASRDLFDVWREMQLSFTSLLKAGDCSWKKKALAEKVSEDEEKRNTKMSGESFNFKPTKFLLFCASSEGNVHRFPLFRFKDFRGIKVESELLFSSSSAS